MRFEIVGKNQRLFIDGFIVDWNTLEIFVVLCKTQNYHKIYENKKGYYINYNSKKYYITNYKKFFEEYRKIIEKTNKIEKKLGRNL